MDSNYIFRAIASKATYIADVATGALAEKIADDERASIADTAKLRDILQQLENIADVLDEYVNW